MIWSLFVDIQADRAIMEELGKCKVQMCCILTLIFFILKDGEYYIIRLGSPDILDNFYDSWLCRARGERNSFLRCPLKHHCSDSTNVFDSPHK